jgi:hypothetical protein
MPMRVCGRANGSRVHGITYDVSEKNTSAIYLEFLPALNAKRVQLLDLPRLIGQLVGLERKTTRGGRDSIAHAPGSHDDLANAACGALVQVVEDRRPTLIKKHDLVSEKPEEFKGPRLYSACVWVGMDGMGGWCITARIAWWNRWQTMCGCVGPRQRPRSCAATARPATAPNPGAASDGSLPALKRPHKAWISVTS